MAISLLSPTQFEPGTEMVNEKIVYHLSLDRSFSYICADVKKRERFLSVVSAVINDREEIIYRQDILKDFEKHPALFEQLSSLSVRFEELRLSQKNAGKGEFRLKVTGTASSAASKNILQVQALCLKRALLFIESYGEILEKYDLRSSGLTNLYKACREICESHEFSNLIAFCSKYENFSENGTWNFRFVLSDEGHIKEYDLIDHKYIHVTDRELKKKGFSLFRKEEDPGYSCERIYPPPRDGLFESLAISAISGLSALLGSIAEQIFLKFGFLFRELVFYDVALKYINALSQKKVPICYPGFSEDQNITVRKLYDLYLLMSKEDPSSVVPNDFVIEQATDGLLVFGDNGNGKTVYLRSIGTMQLLAQAGLPIPCESAEITLFSQIATQFSEAEKDFFEDNDAGRFEQEVRELAAMVDTLKEGALVFLNETFQSTAYEEGAEGLYHLLKYFSSLNIRWILVSHLRHLKDAFGSSEAKVTHIEKYKIE